MSSQPCKVLVLGDVAGRWGAAIAKINKLHSAHGPFAAVFCVGKAFSDGSVNDVNVELEPLRSGKLKLGPTVYFISGDETKSQTGWIEKVLDGGEIAPNLVYLGRTGVKSLDCGLRVAYLSGIYDDNCYNDRDGVIGDGSGMHDDFTAKIVEREHSYIPGYLKSDVDKVINDSLGIPGGVDVLLTAEWPKGWHRAITNTALYPKGLDDKPECIGVDPIARIAAGIPTRYHFAGSEGVYLMNPVYRNILGLGTRFIALGELGGAGRDGTKQKDVYAFGLVPVSQGGTDTVSGTLIECPYVSFSNTKTTSSMDGEAKQGLASNRTTNPGVDANDDDNADEPPAKRMRSVDGRSVVVASRGNVGGGVVEEYTGISTSTRMEQLEAEEAARYQQPGMMNGYMAWNLRPPPHYTCHICHVRGEHYIRDCPVKAERDKERALAKEQGQGQGQGGSGNTDNSKPPPGYVCNICRGTDHYIRECPVTKERDEARQRGREGDRSSERGSDRDGGKEGSSKLPAGYVCKVCNAVEDHYLRECPVKKERDDARAKANAEGRPGPGYVCKICGSGDHFIHDCPLKGVDRGDVAAMRPPEGYTCSVCGGNDHYMFKCIDIISKSEDIEGGDISVTTCKLCGAAGEHSSKDCPMFSVLEAQAITERAEVESLRAQLQATSSSSSSSRSRKRERDESKRPTGNAECWFCLSSSGVATHLIASIGTEMYLALPKGPLVDDHVLVLPVQHVACVADVSADGEDELEKYKSAIRMYAAGLTKYVFFYERYMPTRGPQHMQLQAIPLDIAQALRCVKVLNDEFKRRGLKVEELHQDDDVMDVVERIDEQEVKLQQTGLSGGQGSEVITYAGGRMGDGTIAPYILFELPDVDNESPLATRRFVFKVPFIKHKAEIERHRSSQSASGEDGESEDKKGYVPQRFPGDPVDVGNGKMGRIQDLLDVPREIAAIVLGKPERSNWRNCCMSEQEETNLTSKFKADFAKYDFTLTED